MNARTGLLAARGHVVDDAFDDACVISIMTRSESLTLPNRQRSEKRVIRVIWGEFDDASLIDVVARARTRAHKATNPETASYTSSAGAR